MTSDKWDKKFSDLADHLIPLGISVDLNLPPDEQTPQKYGERMKELVAGKSHAPEGVISLSRYAALKLLNELYPATSYPAETIQRAAPVILQDNVPQVRNAVKEVQPVIQEARASVITEVTKQVSVEQASVETGETKRAIYAEMAQTVTKRERQNTIIAQVTNIAAALSAIVAVGIVSLSPPDWLAAANKITSVAKVAAPWRVNPSPAELGLRGSYTS